MLDVLVVIPSAPLLIPGLADPLAARLPELTHACANALTAARSVPELLVVAPGERSRCWSPGQVLANSGFTASDQGWTTVTVPGAPPSGSPATDAALGTLVALAQLNRIGYDGRAHCVEISQQDPNDFVIPDTATGALVLADGDTSRLRRHLAADEDPEVHDEQLAQALGTGTWAGLRSGLRGLPQAPPALWALSARGQDTGSPFRARCHYRQAPLGLCYQVWTWQR